MPKQTHQASQPLIELVQSRTHSPSLYENTRYLCERLAITNRPDYNLIYDGLQSGDIPQRFRKKLAWALDVPLEQFESARKATLSKNAPDPIIYPNIEIIRKCGEPVNGMSGAYSRGMMFKVGVELPSSIYELEKPSHVIAVAQRAVAKFRVAHANIVHHRWGPIHYFKLHLSEHHFVLLDVNGNVSGEIND